MAKIGHGQIQDLNLEVDHDPGLKADQDLERKADQGRAQIDQNQDLDLEANHDQFQDQGLRVNRLKDLNQCHAHDQTVQATEVQVVQDHVQGKESNYLDMALQLKRRNYVSFVINSTLLSLI